MSNEPITGVNLLTDHPPCKPHAPVRPRVIVKFKGGPDSFAEAVLDSDHPEGAGSPLAYVWGPLTHISDTERDAAVVGGLLHFYYPDPAKLLSLSKPDDSVKTPSMLIYRITERVEVPGVLMLVVEIEGTKPRLNASLESAIGWSDSPLKG